MTESILSLRKFAEALNCINESEVYIITSTPLTFSIYKYRTLVQEYPISKSSYISANEYFVKEIIKYLKDGGMIEQEKET